MSLNADEIKKAREALGRLDPALARANNTVPPFEWRTRAKGFRGLVAFIVEQQVSVASARAIWLRLETGLDDVTPEQVLKKNIDELKTFGLSASKAKYIHGVAQAHASGEVDLDELSHLADEAACGKFIALNGIGRWTAEAYLMWCEARTDVFPAGDIALQEAVPILEGKASRPSIKELYARSEKWHPYRSIAAHLLWGYYTGIKQNVIVMPRASHR